MRPDEVQASSANPQVKDTQPASNTQAKPAPQKQQAKKQPEVTQKIAEKKTAEVVKPEQKVNKQ